MAIIFNTMSQANLRVDVQDLEDAKAMLEDVKNGFVRAYARALNKTIDGVSTDMVTMARDDYQFKRPPRCASALQRTGRPGAG
jgi:hypothetical protein